MKPIFWTGYCKRDRIAAISEIENCISIYGYITDFKQFSDVSLSICIEVAKSKIDLLYLELSKCIILDDFEWFHSDSEVDCQVFLHISFSQGKGDLKVVIPEVPG